MPIITVELSESENQFLEGMAKREGTCVSDLLRTTTLEVMEDKYDAAIADEAYAEYLKNPVTYTLEEVLAELGLDLSEL